LAVASDSDEGEDEEEREVPVTDHAGIILSVDLGSRLHRTASVSVP
jgi:hypothetical protein